MPIRFRCGYCNRLLGIARRKAGTETTCPHCGYVVTVPDDPGDAQTDDPLEDNRREIEDLEALLNPGTPADQPPPTPVNTERSRTAPDSIPRSHSPSPAATVPSPREPRPASSPKPKPPSRGEDRPLFERDLDAVLGTPRKESDNKAETKTKPPPTSGMDALSLESERGHIVLSAQKATALAVAVVVLLALAFAAGFLLASAK